MKGLAPIDWQNGSGAEVRMFMRVLLLVRVAVFTVALGGTGFLVLSGEGAEAWVRVGALLVAAYVVSGLYWAAFRRSHRSRFQVYGPMVVDLMVNTWIVHYSGGIESPFAFLYMLTILSVGAVFQTRPAMVAAGISAACFGGLGWLEFSGVLRPAVALAMKVDVSRDVVYAFFHVVLQMGFFFATAVGAGTLSERLRVKGEALATTKAELQDMKHDTESILENMPSGVIGVDQAGVVVSFNRAAGEMLQTDPARAIGIELREALGPGRVRFCEVVEAVLGGGRAAPRVEIVIEQPGGREAPIGVSVSVLSGRGGSRRGAVAVFQDLTEVERMRAQIRRSDRLAAVGELSAAIAHEIRNPLASISGSIEMLRAEPALSEENARLMGLVLKEARRLKRITSEFLDFASAREKRISAVELAAVFREVVCLFRGHPQWTDEIDFEVLTDSKIGRAHVDEEQLKQVLLNLGFNALEAMTGCGRLVLAANVACPDDAAWEESENRSQSGDRWDLRLTVEDTGCGIPADEQEKVFQPFYSSKTKGVGLGLGIVCRIVEDHGGRVQLDSTVGRGTRVTIFLPRCADVETQTAGRPVLAGVS